MGARFAMFYLDGPAEQAGEPNREVEILRTILETEDAYGGRGNMLTLPVDTDRESDEMIPGLPESLSMLERDKTHVEPPR
jgi:hypothetical protein